MRKGKRCKMCNRRVEVVSKFMTDDEREVILLLINDKEIQIRVDLGCRKVLIPEKMFQEVKRNTPLKKTKMKLRPFGVNTTIEVLGRAKVELATIGGLSMEE